MPACATGGRVRDPRIDKRGDPPRHLCPMVAHAPRSLEGQAVLDLVKAGQGIKRGFSGFEGLDSEALLARLAHHRPRIAPWIAYALIDACQAGIFAGLNDRENPPDEGDEETV